MGHAAGCAAVGTAPEHDAGPVEVEDASTDQIDRPEYWLGRLLVSHAESADLTVYDLDQDRVVGELVVGSDARVYTLGMGRYGYVHADGFLKVVDPGRYLLSHVDHYHVVDSSLTLLEETLPLAHPTQLSASDGWVTACDEAGQVRYFQERGLSAGTFGPRSVDVGVHAGVAAIAHGSLFASRVQSDVVVLTRAPSSDPAQFEVLDGCEAPVALSVAEDTLIARCTDSILFAPTDAESGQPLALQRVPAPAPAAHVGDRLRSLPDRPWAIVSLGRRELARVEAGEFRGRARFDADVVAFELRRAPRLLIVLTVDGVLHELMPEDMTIGRTLPLLDSLASGDAPMLVLGAVYGYVNDVASRTVRRVRLRSFSEEPALAFEREPTAIALVGLPAAYRDPRE